MHFINSQNIKLKVASLDDAHKIQPSARQFLSREMPEILEEILDQLPAEKHFRIEKIELNLGKLSQQNWEQELRGKLTDEILKYFHEHGQEHVISNEIDAHLALNTSRSSDPSSVQNPFTSSEVVNSSNKLDHTIPVENLALQTQLTHYLLTGTMPWYWKTQSESMKVMVQKEFKKNPYTVLQWITPYLQQHEVVLRLSQLLGYDLICNLAFSTKQEPEKSLHKEFVLFLENPKQPTPLLIVLCKQIFTHWKTIQAHTTNITDLFHDKVSSLNPIRKKFIALLMEGAQISNRLELEQLIQFIRNLDQQPKNNPFWTQILSKKSDLTLMRKTLLQFLIIKEKNGKTTQPEKLNLNIDLPQIELVKKSLLMDGEQIDSTPPLKTPKTDFLTIENAGMILLSAFIPSLFKQNNWTQKGEFTSAGIQHKACIFLHFLWQKELPEDESSLMLNKILCGIPLASALKLNFSFTKEEIENSEAMLVQMASTWEAIRSKVGDSIRNGFFARKGILKPTEMGWSLNIERQGMDLLIDRLPWSISTIKLPWNDYLIQTEW